ncbi:hypothetical protein WA026_001046 [Henosepilachna vigintioctopunctata]|uniref:Uncharacterized protein n=1 Tax=Henosepilachna vigintioctopunctata TaxID=420089 RepID=A0AAW1V621_9CUCU
MFAKLVFTIFLAACTAAPQQYYNPNQYQYNQYNRPFVPIVSQTNEINPDGSFRYGYVSGDGQQAEAQGFLKNAGARNAEAEVIQGSYSYTAPDGTPISLRYIADENGFRAEGAHLPVAPPIPAAIQRSLDYIAQTQRIQPLNPYYNPKGRY